MKKFLLLVLVLGAVSFTNAQVDLADGLIACYPFNGDALDQSGNMNDGSVIGAILGPDRFGNPNSAYSFNGSNERVEVNHTFLPSREISISFWSMTTNLTGNFAFFLYPEDVDDRLAISVNYSHGGVPAIFWDYGSISGNGRLGDFPVTPVLNAWEHYVFIASNSKDSMLVYRDGLLQKGENFSDILDDTSRVLRIGSGPGIMYFHGSIDDINIYNRAINVAEVKALYQGGMCGEPSSISMVDKPNISVNAYPNPFTDQITIELDKLESNNLSLVVYDAIGNIVSTQPVNSKKVIFKRDDLASGVYFYCIKDIDNMVVGKGKMAIQ